jgi:Cu(I)-responsive transcriptional regulator
MKRTLNIGEAAAEAGVSAKMIRHYEEIGLLPAPARTEAGYRQYGAREVSVLRFIRQCRRLGFSMPQIAELMGLWSDSQRASREVKALAQRHVADLEVKMRELAEVKEALERLVAACHGDDDPHCAILDELAAASPQAPQAGAVVSRPARKPSGAAAAARPPAKAAASTSHVDLMAWTRQGHAPHADH